MLHQLRIRYSTIVAGRTLNHIQRTWIRLEEDYPPGEDIANMNVSEKGGGTTALDLWVKTAYLGAVRPMFHTSSNFSTYEIWQFEDDEDEVGEFIQANTIGLAGTGTNATVSAGQAMITFRGGSPSRQARLNFMESIIDSKIYDPYPIANSVMQAVANFAISSSSAFVTLKNQYLTFAIAGSYGENEALFRKRNRE